MEKLFSTSLRNCKRLNERVIRERERKREIYDVKDKLFQHQKQLQQTQYVLTTSFKLIKKFQQHP